MEEVKDEEKKDWGSYFGVGNGEGTEELDAFIRRIEFIKEWDHDLKRIEIIREKKIAYIQAEIAALQARDDFHEETTIAIDRLAGNFTSYIDGSFEKFLEEQEAAQKQKQEVLMQEVQEVHNDNQKN